MSDTPNTIVIQSSAANDTAAQALIATAVKAQITVKEGKDVKVLKPVTAVVRNGVALPLFETDIERAKGEKVGVTYLAPHAQWVKDNTALFIQWLGDVIVRRWCASKIKNVLQGLNEEACADLVDKEGNIVFYPNKNPKIKEPKPDYQQFSLQEYVDLVEELSPRSETLVEINEAIISLANELAELDPDAYAATPEGNAAYRKDRLAIKSQIQSYMLAKDKKKRHKAETLAAEADEQSTAAEATAKA